ncbi:MAG: hypothetical protein AAF636_24000, partial [Pseudomonadota bacterium]
GSTPPELALALQPVRAWLTRLPVVPPVPTVAAALSLDLLQGDAAETLNLLAGAADVDQGETETLQVTNVVGLTEGVMIRPT